MKRTGNENINTKEYWDKRYKDRQSYEDETGHARFENALERITANQKVLDIGCGVGTFCKMVKDKYPSCIVCGIDISERAIEENKKVMPEIEWIAGKLEDSKLDSDFDLVFSGETLEHLDDPEVLFEIAYRALKVGGELIITTPKNDMIDSPEHTWMFDTEDIEKLYLSSGFSLPVFLPLANNEHKYVFFAVGRKVS